VRHFVHAVLNYVRQRGDGRIGWNVKGLRLKRDETQIYTVDFLVMINDFKTGFIETNFRM